MLCTRMRTKLATGGCAKGLVWSLLQYWKAIWVGRRNIVVSQRPHRSSVSCMLLLESAKVVLIEAGGLKVTW